MAKRVRLFTGRAGQAQYPEYGVLMAGGPLSHYIPLEIREGHLVPKEPGFRDNHLVNEERAVPALRSGCGPGMSAHPRCPLLRHALADSSGNGLRANGVRARSDGLPE